MRRERGLHELYNEDVESADWQIFARRSSIGRRGFMRGLGSMGALLGMPVAYHEFMPGGLIPAAFADSLSDFVIEGKDGLSVLNDRPVNAETPPHLLDDNITPSNRLFIRNNGIPPEDIDVNTWTLSVEGESALSSKTYSIADLKSKFEVVSNQLSLECGGNGRAFFNPPASGNQWTLGAVGCPKWTGVRLRDVLNDVGIKGDAVYVAYYGGDSHLSGNPEKVPISRGVPVHKALEEESMIAWEMNDASIPLMNGHPLRLVTSGWPGSTSGKWLQKIVIRDRVHDGPKMTGSSYRTPCNPVSAGSKVAKKDMCIIEAMPVKSLITTPRTGLKMGVEEVLNLRGHAWAGDLKVSQLDISIDFGQTWKASYLEEPVNRLAWQNFRAEVKFPKRGYYEVWARARDELGRSQPMLIPGWNPKGYLNNSAHRVAVFVS